MSVFIVAEIGINHNGDLNLCKQIIDAAVWAGADAVKFQKRTVGVVYAGQIDEPRQSPWGKTLGLQKLGLEFSRKDYDQIALYCEQVKMPWFASAWDLESLDFLRDYDLPWNKIASAMAVHWPLVAAVARQGKPTLLSTAMCTDKQLFQAVGYFTGVPLTLMHCIGVYPAQEWMLNVLAMKTLHDRFGLSVGYSGHESSVSPSVMAAVLGATAIERHLTTDRTLYGSDQAASLEPHGFKSMVDQIRKVPLVLGDGVRRILPEEETVARKLRYFERKGHGQEGKEDHKDPNRKVIVIPTGKDGTHHPV